MLRIRDNGHPFSAKGRLTNFPKSKPIPNIGGFLAMPWDDWLTITETLEDQLYLEIQARMLAEITDFDYLLDVAVNYQRQNWQKDEIIKNCIAKIGDLETELIKVSLKKEREEDKSKIKKVFHQPL